MHTPRVNHPLTGTYPAPRQLTPEGDPYPNFTRLEVYAQTGAFTNWFKVSVDLDGPFVAEPQTVPSE